MARAPSLSVSLPLAIAPPVMFRASAPAPKSMAPTSVPAPRLMVSAPEPSSTSPTISGAAASVTVLCVWLIVTPPVEAETSMAMVRPFRVPIAESLATISDRITPVLSMVASVPLRSLMPMA